MITLSQGDRDRSGGMLAALADKSIEYVASTFSGLVTGQPREAVEALERVIVHTDPHLDEYVADVVFRACLPPHKQQAEAIEQAIFSAEGDSGCRLLWPTAAVLGIGSSVSEGVDPLFLFDEHVSGQNRVAASCSQIVSDKMLLKTPSSLARILVEINAVDEFGGAHPQSLANLAKGLHELRLASSEDEDDIATTTLTVEWKRAVISACVAAILYCLENWINLIDEPKAKRDALEASLSNYISNSPHAQHPRFGDAVQRLRSMSGDQAKVFSEANLRDHRGPILDSSGMVIPQLFLFSRVCFALEKAWGPSIRDIVAMHFWESQLQKQIHFYMIEQALQNLFQSRKDKRTFPGGTVWRDILPPINVVEVDRKGGPNRARRLALWILGLSSMPGLGGTNQALQSFLNRENHGCGLMMLQNPSLGTTALFKGSTVPESKWVTLVQLIQDKEPDCWHVIYNSAGTIAPFILNGNKAHQYVPRSALDGSVLKELVLKTFY